MADKTEYFQSVPLHTGRGGHQHNNSPSSNELYPPFRYEEIDSARSLTPTPVDDKDGLRNSSTFDSTTSTIAPPRRARTFWFLRNAQSWTLERLCLLASILSIVAILVLFVLFDDKPLADWTFYFSLNTVASTLGTVAKSSLMLAVGSAIGQGKWQWFYDRPQPLRDFDTFDEASRGPLGSFSLLWALRGRHLATIGAAVTIISAASDPFLQAVVNYEGRLDTIAAMMMPANGSVPMNGIIARTDRWAGLDKFAFIQATAMVLSGNKFVSHPKRQDFDITSAFYSGISSYDDTGLNGSTPNFNCPTGNCTSPIYTSVAVCSKCANLATSVQTSPIVRGTPEAVLRSVENPGTLIGNFTNYTLPNLWMDNCCVAENSQYTSYMTSALSLAPEDTNAFKDMETMLGAITFLRATPIPRNLTKNETTLPSATECALYLCVNAYQSNVTNGFMDERTLASWTTRIPESYGMTAQQPLGVNITNMSAVHSTSWMPPYQPVYVNRTDYQLTMPLNSHAEPIYGSDRTFNVSQAAIVTFQDFLGSMFSSSAPYNASAPSQRHELAYGRPDGPLFTTPIMQPFLGNLSAPVDLGDVFARIARSMTSNIRNTGAAGSQRNQQATMLQQYVMHYQIVWGFFALPFGVTLLGCVYALYTIHRAGRHGLPTWKTSVLASLTHGIDGETRDGLKRLSLNDQKQVASDTLVSLTEKDGVIALRSRG